jgi:hypothetical protein
MAVPGVRCQCGSEDRHFYEISIFPSIQSIPSESAIGGLLEILIYLLIFLPWFNTNTYNTVEITS